MGAAPGRGGPLFALGLIVATPGALALLEASGVAAADLLGRHRSGDWGDVPGEDARENERSIRYGWRILSSYPVGEDGDRVWIITEADRSSTCILLPEDY
jgi:hypothetical protein